MAETLHTDPNRSAAGHHLGIFIDIDWGSDVAAKLISASFRMQRFEMLLRTLGRKIVYSTRRGFDEMTSPEGVRWPGLKHPRGKGHNPIPMVLQDSYKLIDSNGYAPEPPIDEVRIGYGMDYGRWHMKGTRFMPQRRFLGLRPGDTPAPEVMEHVRISFREGGKACPLPCG